MKLTITCLLVLALITGAACTRATEAPPETELPPATTEGGVIEEDIEAARQVVFAYFDALNNYDLEAALACLEESWGNEKELDLSGEIKQMKTYGVTLTVEEEAEATVTTDDRIELYIKIYVSMALQPDRHAAYQLMEIDGEWKICHYEYVG
jgi:hypothetical protein